MPNTAPGTGRSWSFSHLSQLVAVGMGEDLQLQHLRVKTGFFPSEAVLVFWMSGIQFSALVLNFSTIFFSALFFAYKKSGFLTHSLFISMSLLYQFATGVLVVINPLIGGDATFQSHLRSSSLRYQFKPLLA